MSEEQGASEESAGVPARIRRRGVIAGGLALLAGLLARVGVRPAVASAPAAPASGDCDDCPKPAQATLLTMQSPSITWQRTTMEQICRIVPPNTVVWYALEPPSTECHARANIVICEGTCRGGLECRPDPNNFVKCFCQ